MDVLMKVLYNGPRMRNCTFLGQQILFLLFLRRLLLFLGGAVFWEEEDGQRLMRYMVLFCIGRAYTLGVDVLFFGA